MLIMKIPKGTKFGILLVILLEVSFFSFNFLGNSFYSIHGNQQQILSVLCITIMILFCRFKPIINKKAIFRKTILYFLLLYLVVFVYSCLKYKQGIMNVFIASNFNLMLLFYFVLSFFFCKNKRNFQWFNNTILNVALIYMIINLLQYFLYKVGIVFLHFNDNNVRLGALRINTASNAIIFLAIIIAFANILCKKSNKKHIAVFILGIVSFIYVSRGRMAIVGLGITLVSMILYANKKNIKRLIIYITLIFIIITIGLTSTSIGKMYLKSLETEDTTSIRIREIEFYMEEFKESPILGVGFIRSMGHSEVTKIVRGPNVTYSRTDVGIVGFINEFGIMGILWYFYLLFSMYCALKKITKEIDKSSILVFGIFVWNISYLPSMMLFYPFSVIIIPIELAYLNHIYIDRKLCETQNH